MKKTNEKIDVKIIVKSKKKSENKKPDSSYAWLSLIFACLFWVPFLNIILFLPASIYFGIRAVNGAKKNPKIYGGYKLAIFCIVWASFSFIFSIIVLILILTGKIKV